MNDDKQTENMIDETLTETQLDQLFQALVKQRKPSPERINKAVRTAHFETGISNILMYLLVKIWIPVISISSIFFVFINQKAILSRKDR